MTDNLINLHNFVDEAFSIEIITWQKQYGRHTLPWQNTKDAYRVWLSEIMLQQTQVSTVILYYQNFLQSFPDVQSLAVASIQAVMAHWSGLGYYARARNLHLCAQRVVEKYNGYFPMEPTVLISLPGIGRSTAAAIAVFAYGKYAAILDGNVKRIFTRVFGIHGITTLKLVENKLWWLANALLPSKDIIAYTQGLMDLGSTLCIVHKPLCHLCPLANRCIAKITCRTHELPARRLKKILRQEAISMLIISNGADILLAHRPHRGIWGGLFSLPEMEFCSDQNLLCVMIAGFIKSFAEVVVCVPLQSFVHVFTHFKLKITPYYIEVKNCLYHLNDSNYFWFSIRELRTAPLPSPVKKLLLNIFK